MTTKIAIIDYGFGNIQSVLNSLDKCGSDACVITNPMDISKFHAAILPGVGSFGPASDFLIKNGFCDAIKEFVANKKMLLGICLGFQLLFSIGHENGKFCGLNLIEGEVKKFQFTNKNLKIPHMGWNNIKISSATDAKKMFSGINDNEYFYFVHSYYAIPKNKESISAITNYGYDFCSAIAYENIWGCQFHPEKSADAGLKIISNFIKEADK